MKNRISDLNNHFFAALERLSDESLDYEQLNIEIQRSQAISKVGEQVIKLAETSLEALKLQAEYGQSVSLPEMLTEHKKLPKAGA